jgi:hypothetical protein
MEALVSKEWHICLVYIMTDFGPENVRRINTVFNWSCEIYPVLYNMSQGGYKDSRKKDSIWDETGEKLRVKGK